MQSAQVLQAVQDWSQVLALSFQNLWLGVIDFLPNIIVSLIIFVIGWAFGSIIGSWVANLLKALKLDKALQTVGIDEVVTKAGFKLDAGWFIGGLVKWFIIIAFLMAALEVVHLTAVNDFLRSILNYLPSVIVAALMLIVAAPIAEVMQRVVTGSAKAAGVDSGAIFGGITRWAVWIFALLFALNQLGIAGAFAQTLFTGLIAMLALAGGLAFGLGGRDSAARYLDKLRQDISNR